MKLIRFFRRIAGLIFAIAPRHTFKDIEYKYMFKDDVPDKLKDNTIYFIGEDPNFYQFVMLCPCKCGNILHMNLVPDTKPVWSYTFNHDKVSFSPSVHRKIGCESHFFIKNSRILWC